jgi:aryl-alcohol dehydrogenase-like predicted oxidoreductase
VDVVRWRGAGRGVARLWGVPRFDLLQVHNLLAWEKQLPLLLAMKQAGKLRYVGITTSEGRRHKDFEQLMRQHPLDTVQLTYNPLDREAEQRLLPLARERGMAVIVNRPFREGDLLRACAATRCPAGPRTSAAPPGRRRC